MNRLLPSHTHRILKAYYMNEQEEEDFICEFVSSQASKKFVPPSMFDESQWEEAKNTFFSLYDQNKDPVAQTAVPDSILGKDLLIEVHPSNEFPKKETLRLRRVLHHSISKKNASPELWICKEFLSAEECAQFVELGKRRVVRQDPWTPEWGGAGHRTVAKFLLGGESAEEEAADDEEKRLRRLLQRKVSALTGVRPGAGGSGIQLTYSAAEETGFDTESESMTIGLHLDANNGRPYRWCTVVIYLNSVGEGGHTVFPCVSGKGRKAEAPEQVSFVEKCGEALAAMEVSSTLDPVVVDVAVDATTGELDINAEAGAGVYEAAHLTKAAEHGMSCSLAGEMTRGCLCVPPIRGDALVFYSMTPGMGSVPDGLTWHGGAATTSKPGKWTLQVFEEIPESVRGDESKVNTFLKNRVMSSVEDNPGDGGIWTAPTWAES